MPMVTFLNIYCDSSLSLCILKICTYVTENVKFWAVFPNISVNFKTLYFRQIDVYTTSPILQKYPSRYKVSNIDFDQIKQG